MECHNIFYLKKFFFFITRPKSLSWLLYTFLFFLVIFVEAIIYENQQKKLYRNKGTKIYWKLILKKLNSFYIFLMNYNS